MNLTIYTNRMEDYLEKSCVVDWHNTLILQLADTLAAEASDELVYIREAYEFVRDTIFHSADINNDTVTCSASDIFKAGHGICFAKSHLLAALLRAKNIPAGFCYQKLLSDDGTAQTFVYHGLNGVYIKKYDMWIRLDARGNKNGINAQFTVNGEQLAFPIRTELGETDIPVVYPEPDANVLQKLRTYKSRTELCRNLPENLAYNK